MIRFEWDAAKARANQRKHSVAFEDAALIFDDPYALFEQDRVDEMTGEARWRALGAVGGIIVLMVAHTVRPEEQDEVIRIISARRANRKERKSYEQSRAQDAE